MRGAGRLFRVFVSSPFIGLTEERNALHRDVFRPLGELCRSQRARFQAIDLRWGVSQEAGLEHTTMEICFAEIERCHRTGLRPNFLVLLGDRYGWCPLRSAIEARELESLLPSMSAAGRNLVTSWYRLDANGVPPAYRLQPRIEDYVDGELWEHVEHQLHGILSEAARKTLDAAPLQYQASATHQEIVKALGGDHEGVLAFCRTTNDASDEVDRLKRFLINELGGANVIEYADLATLCATAHERLESVIQSELRRSEPVAPLDREVEADEVAACDTVAKQYARHFAGRHSILDTIAGSLTSDDRRPLVIHGASGSGKSAIVAMASARAATAPADAVVIRRFIGATPESSSGPALLRSVCRELARRYGIAADVPAAFDAVAVLFRERLALATEQRPLVLFFDAVDALPPDDPAAALSWIPERLPRHCCMVLSAIEVPPSLQRTLPVDPFDRSDAEAALSLRLRDAQRTLQPWQREKVLSAIDRCRLPLYLDLAFEEARRWRSTDELEACILGEGLDGAIDHLVGRLSRSHGPGLVRRTLAYVTASRFGLSEDEIVDVLTGDAIVWNDFERAEFKPPERRLPDIVWSRLFFDLEPYLAERVANETTVMTFYHRHIAHRFATMRSDTDARAAHRGLADIFRRAGDPQSDGSWTGSARALAELPHHLAATGDHDALEKLLLSIHYQDARCNQGDVHALLADFGLAQRDGDLAEMHDFLLGAAQRLERRRDILFSRIRHEGPSGARSRADALMQSHCWNRTWLRTVPVLLPPPATPGAGTRLRMLAQHRFPVSTAIALAEGAEIAFQLKVVGRIGLVDARSMRELPGVLNVPALPVLGMFASTDARSLAVALEDGELVIVTLNRSDDGRLLRQGTRSMRYFVPELERPFLRWDGEELFLQRPDGALVIVSATSERVVLSDCAGELSGAVRIRGEWWLAIRQPAGTSIRRCGAGETIEIRAADAVAVECDMEGRLLIAFSDRTVRIFETMPRLREAARTRATQMPRCVAGWNGSVLWAGVDGFCSWDPRREAIDTIEDDAGLFSSGRFVGPRQLVPRDDGSLLLLAQSLVCRMRIEPSEAASMHTIEEALVDRDGAVYAIEKRASALWMVNCTSGKELLITADMKARHFHALNGEGQMLTVAASGTGSAIDLRDHRSTPVKSPQGANALVAVGGKFWAADRFGGIYQYLDGRMHHVATAAREDVRGGRLWPCGRWIVWEGTSTKASATNAHGDIQDALVFFEIGVAPALRDLGMRAFVKEDGRLQVVSRGAGDEVIAVFRDHASFPLCAKLGVPEAFLKHEEKTIAMDFAESIHDCVMDAEDNLLYLCSDDDLVVVDAITMQTRARLAASRPFRSLGGNGHRDVTVVEGGRHLYRCSLEVPHADPE